MFIVLAVRLSPAAPEHRLSPAACLPPAVTTTLLQVWCHVGMVMCAGATTWLLPECLQGARAAAESVCGG
eukprot:COSAG01_NODE_51694_length_352_cov_4.430830_1_plen_69_part_01